MAVPPELKVVIYELIAGRLDPALVPLPFASDFTPWLDELERDVFDEAPCETASERAKVRCDRGGFRIVRLLSDDDAYRIAERLERVARESVAPERCFRRLQTEFAAFGSMPGHGVRTIH
jgi:hypothetical protein